MTSVPMYSKEAPSVSIAIPFFNRVAFLQDCVESVVKQTFERWEAIVVDDASREDPEPILLRINDRRVRLIRHGRNRGPGAALNTGFTHARAELVVALGSDDLLHPDFLEIALEALSAVPEADCVFTDYQCFGDSESIWRQTIRTPKDMLKRNWIPGGGTILRRGIWSEIGGFAEDLEANVDWDFWIGAAERGIRPVHVSQALYLYRRHENSLSRRTRPAKEYEIRQRIYGRHRRFFRAHGLGRKFRARGYLHSSDWALHSDARLFALGLAFRGLLLAPTDRVMLIHILRCLIPRALARRLGASLHGGRCLAR